MLWHELIKEELAILDKNTDNDNDSDNEMDLAQEMGFDPIQTTVISTSLR